MNFDKFLIKFYFFINNFYILFHIFPLHYSTTLHIDHLLNIYISFFLHQYINFNMKLNNNHFYQHIIYLFYKAFILNNKMIHKVIIYL